MANAVVAVIFPEEIEKEQFDAIMAKAKETFTDTGYVKIHMAIGDAAETVQFFLTNGELPTDITHHVLVPGVAKFKKKPIEINAVQLCWKTWDDVCEFLIGDSSINEFNPGFNIPLEEVSDTCGEEGPEYIAIKVITTHGEEAVVRHGDWIIPDSKPGTYYPCKPDVFAATYDPVVE